MVDKDSPGVLINPTLIEADAYNEIQEFRRVSFDSNIINRFGEVVRRFDLQDCVGATYVHRHFQLSNGSIAVTELLPDGLTITRMSSLESLADDTITGLSFKLIGDRFQAYEYTTQGSAPFLPEPFLGEIARFLIDNQLQDMLGIFIRDEAAVPAPSIEFNFPEVKLSLCIPTDEIPHAMQENAVPAGWVYTKAEDCGQPILGCEHEPTKWGNDEEVKARQSQRVDLIESAMQRRGMEPSCVFSV